VSFYTYIWLEDDGTPYYVGKGTGDRGFSSRRHCCEKPPADRIIAQEFSCEADAYFAEKFLISYYGRRNIKTGCLLNRVEGGTGVKPKGRCKYGHKAKYDDHGNCVVCKLIRNLWSRGWSKKRFCREERKRPYHTLSHDPRFCKFGHAKTSENTVVYRNKDSCKICRLIRNVFNNLLRPTTVIGRQPWKGSV